MKQKMKKLAGSSLLCLMTLTTCSRGDNAKPQGQAVARVNGEEITREQYNFALQAKKNELEARHPVAASKLLQHTLAQQTVTDLIMRTLILQAANKERIKIDKQEISARLKQIKASFKDERTFQEALKKAGISLDYLGREIEEGLIIQKHKEQLLKNIRVSEKEAKVFYGQNLDQFKLPEEYRVSFVWAKTEEEAQELFSRLKKGQVKFDLLLKTHPASFPQGMGETGWVEPSFLPQEFAGAIKSTEPGTITKPVKGKAGFYLIRVEEKKSAGREPFELAKKKIIHSLTEKKKQAAINNWLVEQEKKTRIEIYPAE